MRLFIASYGGGHVTAALPLIAECRRRGHECCFFALTTAAETATRNGFDHVRPIDFVDRTDPIVREWGERLAVRHHTEGKGLTVEESVAYLGVSFRDLARDIGPENAWQRYQKYGLNAFAPVQFLKDVLRQVQCDFVVATTSPRMEMAALRAANQMRIPSLCMVELFGILEERWLSRPDNGDVLAVSRTDVIDRLTAAGRCRDDIFLTGSPAFDGLSDPTLPDRGRTWRLERGIKDRDRVILWAEQPEPGNPELPRRIRRYLGEISRKHGWTLVVRLHPSSTDPRGEHLPEGAVSSEGDDPLHVVVHAADAVVTLTSTVGWETLLADKPLLVAKISAYQEFVTYGQDDGALAVASLDEIEGGLCELLAGGERAQHLAALRRRLPVAGGAAERVATLIEQRRQRR